MKWKKLQHNGIIFPTPFKSRSIKIRINNKEFKPNLLQEEMLYHCAKKNDTKYMSDKIFQKNFIKDLIAVLPNEFRYIKFSDIDFSKINLIIEKEKQKNELMDKDEKKELAVTRKKKREAMKEKYGKAIIDDKEVEVANYIAEPPSIFVGRGDHPLRGKWKPRIYPNNVTLNLGKEATIPDGAWGKVIHDRNSMWLASWKDHLTKKKKYVWLSDTSKIKQERETYEHTKDILA